MNTENKIICIALVVLVLAVVFLMATTDTKTDYDHKYPQGNLVKVDRYEFEVSRQKVQKIIDDRNDRMEAREKAIQDIINNNT